MDKTLREYTSLKSDLANNPEKALNRIARRKLFHSCCREFKVVFINYKENPEVGKLLFQNLSQKCLLVAIMEPMQAYNPGLEFIDYVTKPLRPEVLLNVLARSGVELKNQDIFHGTSLKFEEIREV